MSRYRPTIERYYTAGELEEIEAHHTWRARVIAIVLTAAVSMVVCYAITESWPW